MRSFNSLRLLLAILLPFSIPQLSTAFPPWPHNAAHVLAAPHSVKRDVRTEHDWHEWQQEGGRMLSKRRRRDANVNREPTELSSATEIGPRAALFKRQMDGGVNGGTNGGMNGGGSVALKREDWLDHHGRYELSGPAQVHHYSARDPYTVYLRKLQDAFQLSDSRINPRLTREEFQNHMNNVYNKLPEHGMTYNNFRQMPANDPVLLKALGRAPTVAELDTWADAMWPELIEASEPLHLLRLDAASMRA